MSYTLYFSPGACALGPQIVLRELGLSFGHQRVNLREHTLEDGSDYYAVNPKGAVPALKLPNGELLTEGAVLYQYLSDQKPDANLLPAAGTMARYRALEWLNYIASEVHKSLGAFFQPIYDDATKEKMRGAFAKKLAYLDAHFAKHSYLLGEQFQAVDAYLFNVLNWTKFAQIDLTPYVNVTAFHSRVMARESVQASMKAEGLI
jgi:glutathione S-transferase